MKYILIKLCVCLIAIFSTQVNASNFYGELQTGAQKGLAHVAIGYRFYDKHQLSIGYGTVPKLTDHEELSIFSASYMFHGTTQFDFQVKGFELAFKPINFGVSFLQGDHDALFKTLPEQYPDGYYFPTANRLLFEYQSSFELSEKTAVFIKLSIVDVGLANYVRNFSFYRKNYFALGLSGVTTWGIGIERRF